MAKIQKRGRLVAGVSADTYLLGSRNPLHGQIEGFDIDMVKAVAKAIFGNENALPAEGDHRRAAHPALEKGDVDIVARNMTINCDRWKQIAFSTEYYRAGQKILVRKGRRPPRSTTSTDRRSARPIGTSSMDNLIKLAPKAIPVGVGQPHRLPGAVPEGQVDAITGDDTVLAGLAAQDPYAVVPDQKAFTAEPYGLGLQRAGCGPGPLCQRRLGRDADRRRVDQRSTTAGWRGPLGSGTAPPEAVYGRTP